MRELSYSSGLEAQNELARIVLATKNEDPFKHITLLVDSNHQALQFRRQLVRSLSRGGHPTSLVAFSAFTKLDVVSSLARISGIEWDPQDYKNAKQDVLRRVLLSQGEVLGSLVRHPESFAALAKYSDQFDWVELTDALVQRLINAGEASTTKVSLQLLQVAKEVQHQLRVSGKLGPADIISRLSHSSSEAFSHQVNTSLGQVIVVTEDYPSTLAGLLDSLLGSDSQVKINLKRGNSREKETQALSFPDPETETKAVVREVAKRIAAGDSIDEFAVLYTDAAQYADLLENEFEQAQITWNGMATESPVLSLPATATKGYLAVVNSIFQTGTFTRADFISLLRTSSITSNGEKLGSGTFVRFLNRNGLFNEVKNWEPLLQAMVAQIPALESELEMLEDVDAEQDEKDDISFKLDQAKIAASLDQLIREILASSDRLSLATKNADLAEQVWHEINEFFPQLAHSKMPIDRLAFEKLGELFGTQHNGELGSRDDTRDALYQIGQGILLKLAQLKMQHGELARGIYIGPVSQNGALYFENLWIVGAGESMLPQNVSEDPILPDSLKQLFTRETGFHLKSVAARVAEIESNFFAVATGAKNLTISYPRGGTLSKSEGMPSGWLGMLTGSPVQAVPAAFEFRLSEPGAVSTTDLHSKESAALSDTEAASKELASAVWFASPQLTEFAGDLGGNATLPLIDFDQMPLSASTVEKFLKCGHNFFTTKVLGFSDMEQPDSIDEMRSLDFGKAVHSAFERLLKEHSVLTPDFGKPYSDEAVAKFRELFEEECDLIVARGQAGWAPLFESRKREFISRLPEYFTLEHKSRSEIYVPAGKRGSFRPFSAENFLKPQNAEFEFDKTGNGLLQVPVQVEGLSPETLKFKGLIDRVDVSADREHVGIIDFKTGKKKYINAKTSVQDLIYEYAIRRNSNFLGVTKVSSRYLFLSEDSKESGLVSLRPDRVLGVFLSPADGGLTGPEYVSALDQNKLAAELELKTKLALLVIAAHKGVFPTHDTKGAKESFPVCLTCKKLGEKTVSRLSLSVHTGSQPAQEGSEEGQE